MKAALYARFSSENQKDSSIQDQFRNCETRAVREGWEIVARYADRAISGTTADRPQYQQMLKDAQAKCFDILLVDDFSRLSRDQVETEQVRRRLVHWGIRVIGQSDGIDSSHKGHKLLSSMKGMMNEVFLDDLRDKTRRGMVGQALKGYHCGGRSFGYRLVPEYDSTKRDPYGQPARIGTRLEIDEDQAQWVRWIFSQYADGMSPVKIVEELNRQGVPPPGIFYRRKSSQPPTWCASALYGNVTYGLGLLNNGRYIGEVTWGRSRWEKNPDTKRKQRFLCEEQDWIRRSVEHLRIIEDPLWQRVKRRQRDIHQGSAAIRTALHANARTGRGPKYLFSGLLTCGHLNSAGEQCTHKFIIVDPLHYACGGWKYRGQSVCSNTIKVSRAIVESVLFDAIRDDLFTAQGQAAFIQETTKLLTAHRRVQKPDHQQAAKRLQEVEHAIANIMAAITAGIVTASTKTALEHAEAERDALVQSMQPQHKPVAKVAAFLPNAIGRFKALLDDLEHVTQRQVDLTRAQLRVLLGKEIVLHPMADGVTRYLTAEVTGSYQGLLRMVTGQNKSRGGQGS